MLLGPVAIVLYYMAMSQINSGGYSESTRGVAKAGLIMGIIGTCIIALYVIIVMISISI